MRHRGEWDVPKSQLSDLAKFEQSALGLRRRLSPTTVLSAEVAAVLKLTWPRAWRLSPGRHRPETCLLTSTGYDRRFCPMCTCRVDDWRGTGVTRGVAVDRHGRCLSPRHPFRFQSHRVAGSGKPPPAPTERSVPISGTTLVIRGFTAQRGSAADHRSGGVGDAVTESARALG